MPLLGNRGRFKISAPDWAIKLTGPAVRLFER
jgi:hypothetical protein